MNVPFIIVSTLIVKIWLTFNIMELINFFLQPLLTLLLNFAQKEVGKDHVASLRGRDTKASRETGAHPTPRI